MSDLEKIRDEIDAMPPEGQLRLAADLLEAARSAPEERKLAVTRIAHSVADRVVTELGAALALNDMKSGGRRG